MSAADRPAAGSLFALDGEVAIVTGGLGRLGSEYGAALAEAGASVALFDKATAAPPVVRRAQEAGRAITIHRVDLLDRAAVVRATEEVAARAGAPTVLVNNAGLGSPPQASAADNGPFEHYPEASWDAMID